MMLRESLKPFFISFTFALLSVWVANKYFSEARQMAICALTALGLSTLLGQLLESNRQAIWQEKISPWIANRKLAFEFISIFLGIFFAAVVIELISNTQHTELDLNAIYRNKIVALFGHNLNVLIIGTALAVVYRAGGLVLILSWNALHWAEAIFSYIKQLKDQVGLSDAAIIFTSILPHLFLEALSYVIAGLAGVFISIAILKYEFGSAELRRVSIACLTLIGVAVGVLVIATATEVYLGQAVFHALRGS